MPHVTITLVIDDEDADSTSDTGLTAEAFDELTDALSGYSIADGPTRSDARGNPLD